MMYYGVIIIMSKQSFLFAGRRNRSVLQFMKTFLLKFLLLNYISFKQEEEQTADFSCVFYRIMEERSWEKERKLTKSTRIPYSG